LQNSNKTYVSNIQRFSVHDGPGIRTVVFLLGCPLRCKWCQNPETLNRKPQLMINYELCSRCTACISVCPKNAISIGESGDIVTDRKKCNSCGKCVNECYYLARQLSGKSYTVEEVYDEIVKDKVFYANTGGGVTLSGGEPTVHPEFCYELFKKCKINGIHTAIETSGYAAWKIFKRISEVTDLFLYDIKLFDNKKHKKWTGVENKRILENLKNLVDCEKDITIRIPLIPGVNDNQDEFKSIIRFVKSLRRIKSVHILPFHQMGSSKYGMLGIDYQLRNLDEEKEKNIDLCKKIIIEMGLKVSIGGAGFKEDIELITNEVSKEERAFLYRNAK